MATPGTVMIVIVLVGLFFILRLGQREAAGHQQGFQLLVLGILFLQLFIFLAQLTFRLGELFVLSDELLVLGYLFICLFVTLLENINSLLEQSFLVVGFTEVFLQVLKHFFRGQSSLSRRSSDPLLLGSHVLERPKHGVICLIGVAKFGELVY